MPIILVTWEADIRRIVVCGQLEQIVHKTPISKITRAKGTVVYVVQVVQQLPCKSLVQTPVPPKQNKTKQNEQSFISIFIPSSPPHSHLIFTGNFSRYISILFNKPLGASKKKSNGGQVMRRNTSEYNII
jgi:hypothetical protein